MKIQKSELAGKIATIQSIVPRKTTMSVLQGVLVSDGCLIANDAQIAVKVKLEDLAGEKFIIPLHAFSLISSLPEGEIEITAENQVITIKAPKVNVRMHTYDAEAFPLPPVMSQEAVSTTVNGREFADAMKRVFVAVGDGANSIMDTMLFQVFNGVLNLVGLDGRRIAWEQIPCEGDFEMLVPRNTINKLKNMNLDREITISYDNLGAMFETDEFALTTRLMRGKYYDYMRMFDEQLSRIVVSRKDFLAAVERSRICGGDQSALQLELSERTLTVRVDESQAKYEEELQLKEPAPMAILPLTIGFAPKLVIDTLRSLSEDDVSIWLSNSKSPMITEASETTYRGLVMPVNLRANRRA